jgi:hypothetical protein
VFSVDMAAYPEPRMTLRFADGAGLHWQINHDLHLEQLVDRNDW